MLLRPKSITVWFFCLWPFIFGAPHFADEDTELLSSKCQAAEKKWSSQSIGCVAQSLIPIENTYWIEFKDEHEKTASNCFQTCRSVFQNTRYVKFIYCIRVFQGILLTRVSGIYGFYPKGLFELAERDRFLYQFLALPRAKVPYFLQRAKL